MPFQVTAVHSTREYEIQPRKHHRGVDLISDAQLFGHLWYGEPKAVSNLSHTQSIAAVHVMP
jgi:hypothetical protein